jgi:TonB family protein
MHSIRSGLVAAALFTAAVHGIAAQQMPDPPYTPYDQAPRLTRTEIVTMTARRIAAAMAETKRALNPGPVIIVGADGSMRAEPQREWLEIWVHIGTNGVVSETRIRSSSRNERVDNLALELARELVFEPARSGGQPVAVWVGIPFVFQ